MAKALAGRFPFAVTSNTRNTGREVQKSSAGHQPAVCSAPCDTRVASARPAGDERAGPTCAARGAFADHSPFAGARGKPFTPRSCDTRVASARVAGDERSAGTLAARSQSADRSPFAPREESRLLRAHATRVSPRRVPPQTNGPQALWLRAAKVPTVALSLEREESRLLRARATRVSPRRRAAGDSRAAGTLAARCQSEQDNG